MPSIVPGGPDLPPALLHALEDDRLVLFCGAGISIDTGLPSFGGLVEEAAKGCNLALDGPARAAFEAKDYDRTLGHLEDRAGPRSRLRPWIAERLVREPEGPDGALTLHRALLDLTRRPGGGYRLVTTNFDDRFERAGLKPDEMEDAPRLAPPRFDRLRRVVFLHGRIRKGDPTSLADLVLTSRDFGNAYLRDGWATRFLLELLREFHLLLVGYSRPAVSSRTSNLSRGFVSLGTFRRSSRAWRTRRPSDTGKSVLDTLTDPIRWSPRASRTSPPSRSGSLRT